MKKLSLLFFLLFSPIIFAKAPVVDIAEQSSFPIQSSQYKNTNSSYNLYNTGYNHEISKIKSHKYILQSILAKLQKFQQNIQKLRGLIAVQAHKIQQLQIQQRNLYNDLDQRISKLETHVKFVSIKKHVEHSAIPNNFSKNNPIGELQVYLSAFSLIRNKHYSIAINAMKNYLKKYPKGKYVSNAHYWLGEIYAVSGQNIKAKDELFTVANVYPKSNKAPSSLLKLGAIAYGYSDWKHAKQWWEILISRYPESGEAKIAKASLTKLKESGI